MVAIITGRSPRYTQSLHRARSKLWHPLPCPPQSAPPCNPCADHCGDANFALTAKHRLCAAEGGEFNMGGPNWPSSGSTDAESRTACAAACNRRFGCTHYVWFSDKGCRTYTSCARYASGFTNRTEYVCELRGMAADLHPHACRLTHICMHGAFNSPV